MAILAVAGSLNQDLIFHTAQFPAAGETRLGRFSSCLGGKGLNQAVAAARQGVTTRFIAAVGDDLFAEQARDFLQREGIQACLQTVADAHTGVAGITVDDSGENLIVVAAGANDHLSVEHVQAQREAITGAHVLLVQLEAAPEAIVTAMELARQAGVFTLLNPAPLRQDVPAEVWQLADLITPNETEFAWYLKQQHGLELHPDYWMEPETQLHAWARRLSPAGCVLTLGSMGALVAVSDDPEQAFRALPEPVQAIDSTGAGDAFSGALAAGLARQRAAGEVPDWPALVQQAGRVAALAVERPGTTTAFPTLDEVKQRFGD